MAQPTTCSIDGCGNDGPILVLKLFGRGGLAGRQHADYPVQRSGVRLGGSYSGLLGYLLHPLRLVGSKVGSDHWNQCTRLGVRADNLGERGGLNSRGSVRGPRNEHTMEKKKVPCTLSEPDICPGPLEGNLQMPRGWLDPRLLGRLADRARGLDNAVEMRREDGKVGVGVDTPWDDRGSIQRRRNTIANLWVLEGR
eukprot:10216181-Alexandrium_andersonii.AAC.1